MNQMPSEIIVDEEVGDPASQGPAINLRYLLGLVLRYRWLIAAIIATVVVLGVVLTLLITPRYTASASVQIDQQAQRVLQSQETEAAAAYQDADRFLKTQVDVLRSRRMAERVAGELRLLNGDAFLTTMRRPLPQATEGNLPARRREAVLAALDGALSVYLPADSRVVQISFNSPDPELSARVANTYARSFIRYNLERRYDSSAYAREFLSRQLADAKGRLEQSERQSNNYARSIGLIRTSQAGDTTGERPQVSITSASLSQLNTALNDARNARIAAEAKWRRVQGASPLAVAEVVNNQAIQALIEQRSTAEAALRAELIRHRDDFPTVQPLRAQVENINSEISALAAGIRATIFDEYSVSQQRERELAGQVAALKGETLSEQDRSVQLNILTREVDTNRALYDALLQRFKELSAEAGVSNSNVSLIDEARAPFKPSSPNLLLNVAMALLVGTLLAAAALFFIEQVDDRVRKPEDLETKLGLKPLGITPLVEGDAKPFELLQDPKSTISEAYYALRTSLQLATRNGMPSRLMITSAQPSEGKSTTSMALARSVAGLGKRVILIDADLRRPSLHKLFGLDNELGLSSLLADQASPDGAVRDTDFPGLRVLTSGPIPPSPTELLSSDRLPQLLDRLQGEADLIVIDAPPVLGLADSLIMSSFAPVLFVVRANMAHHGNAKGSLRRLRSSNAHLLGAVFTQFDFKAARAYGYGQGYSYGGGYTYYRYE